jgi:hypothetical protein
MDQASDSWSRSDPADMSSTVGRLVGICCDDAIVAKFRGPNHPERGEVTERIGGASGITELVLDSASANARIRQIKL